MFHDFCQSVTLVFCQRTHVSHDHHPRGPCCSRARISYDEPYMGAISYQKIFASALISIADAALVTEDNPAALGDTLFITRLPATYSECERVIGEAVARNRWEEVGVLAQTPSTRHRPGTFYKVAEAVVTLYGKPYRAVVVHSSSQDQRRQKRLVREL